MYVKSILVAKYPKTQMLLMDSILFTIFILSTTPSHKNQKVINSKDTKKGEKERMSTFSYTRQNEDKHTVYR